MLEVFLFSLGGVWQALRQDFNLLELALLAMLIWWGAPKLQWLAAWERALTGFARRRVLACVSVGVLAIVLRLALLPLLPEPNPVVSDEFSHLLLADTLLASRLANPTHPFWVHFESLQIIQKPYYVSNFFPGLGATMAVTRWVVGDPWVAILVSSGLFCGLLCWALQGWMPARWALFGAVLALLRFSIGSYWVNGYYGGFLPATGGALVVGAYARLRHRTTVLHSALLALGIAILASTRPLEGALFSLPFVLTLPLWRWRILAPMTVIVGLAVAALGFYCFRVTGSPFKTAYNVSQESYGWPMAIGWVTPKPIEHRHVELARYYRYELRAHQEVDSPVHWLQYLTFRVQDYWRFFLGPALSLALVTLPFVWRDRRLRVAFAGFGAACIAVLFNGASMPHYFAPATAVIVLLLVQCFRHLRVTPRGLAMARALPCIMVLVLALRIGAANLGLPYTQSVNFQSWCCPVQGNQNKARLTGLLNNRPGPHLVFVRAKTDERNLFQWIYNAADIDRSRIVWARDLGPEANRKLIDYFSGRQVWMVNPNSERSTIAQYP
ncbi:MAG: hypothetical protein ACR2NN_11550 [Bryobacteraceae bacterium]